MVSNVTRTPFKGTEPIGWGGTQGAYPQYIFNSGDCCTNDDSIIKKSSLNTKGLIDTKYKWIHSQYPRYWVKDDDNSYRITDTQGQYIEAKTWKSGSCNFQKAANNDPNNIYECKGRIRCYYWIGGKKYPIYYPYAKWLNTDQVQSQNIYITAGGVARNNCLPPPPSKQPFPMTYSANGCDVNYNTWQQAQAAGQLPTNFVG